MELELARRDVRATVVDSKALWLKQRALASRLGERALVLIGGSRMQLAVDLDVLRARTSLDPVQLAIDGSSFVPVLEGLAADSSFRGSVIVDFVDHHLVASDQGLSPRYQRDYEVPESRKVIPDFNDIEAGLTVLWRQGLRSYADGARPATSLELRIMMDAYPQYLITMPDRSRLANFAHTDPSRLTLGILGRSGVRLPPGANLVHHEAEIRAAIASRSPSLDSLQHYERESRRLAEKVRALSARGSKVYFLVLPKSGFVGALEDRLYPRPLFWDGFAAQIGTPALHFDDVPGMRDLECPDGLHLDYRDRARFTAALAAAFGLDKR